MSIEVQTTQNVVIDYEPAGIGLRIGAWAIDTLVLLVWILGFLGLGSISTINITTTIAIVGIVLPLFIYHFLFELFNRGQSPGKMLMKIRVISLNGAEPTAGMYMIRWLLRSIEIIITSGGIAIVSIMMSKNSQRVGDLLARTTVINLRMDESELLLSELDFHEGYHITYLDILSKLSDKDIRIIQTILNDEKVKNIYIDKMATKIKAITGYNYDGENIAFLKKVISDYNYLASQL